MQINTVDIRYKEIDEVSFKIVKIQSYIILGICENFYLLVARFKQMCYEDGVNEIKAMPICSSFINGVMFNDVDNDSFKLTLEIYTKYIGYSMNSTTCIRNKFWH